MGTLLLATTIIVSAAASLSDVLNEIGRQYEADSGARVQVTSGASNALARQIIEGAPVDLFISADERQMDAVEESGRLIAASRIRLLGNRLVVVVPADGRVNLASARDLASAGVSRVAMANPVAVPAGVYGRRWLERVGLWKLVEPKVIPLPTVRAALAAVREGRAPTAIVYATDASNEPAVRVALTPPPEEVDPIVYAAALIQGPRSGDAARFMKFLRSSQAAQVFRAAGFDIAANP